MAGLPFIPLRHPVGFSLERFDGAECRRLRLALGLNAEKMALVARMSGRWSWLSVENGYESIDADRWAICLAELDNRRFGCGASLATPRYHFDAVALRGPVAV